MDVFHEYESKAVMGKISNQISASCQNLYANPSLSLKSDIFFAQIPNLQTEQLVYSKRNISVISNA